MSLLTKNSLPAERARGLVFAEKFETAEAVVKNGGAITGTPPINFGADFNGSTDFVAYGDDDNKLSFGNGATDSPFSLETLVFIDESDRFTFFDKSQSNSVTEYILATGSAKKIFLTLYDNSTAHFIQVLVDASIVSLEGTWAHIGATYDGSGSETGLTIYVNGVAVAQTQSTGGTYVAMEKTASDLLIGKRLVLGERFSDGEMRNSKVWDKELTAKEMLDAYNNATFNYRNKAVLDLPMGMAQHDPTNTRTLDVSGNGYHFTLGDGDGGATTPTKLTDGKGYTLDGSDDYMIATSTSGMFNTAECSFAVEFTPDFASDDGSDHVLVNAGVSGADDYFIIKTSADALRIDLGNSNIASVANATFSPYWKTNQRNVLVVSGTTGNTSAWLNGNLILDADNSAWSPTDPTEMNIGSNDIEGQLYSGDINRVRTWQEILTPIQVHDIGITMLKQINDV